MAQHLGDSKGQVNHVFAMDSDDFDRIEVISSSSSTCSTESRRQCWSGQSGRNDRRIESIELCRNSHNMEKDQRHRNGLMSAVDEYMRAPTPTNMVRRWSQHIARFSKDNKLGTQPCERTIYRLPSREIFQVDGTLPVSSSPDAGAEVDQLAAEIEQYECLMEDTALSKQNRLETLRALPQPLATKRLLKQKLAHAIEQQLLEEPRRGWGRRLWNTFVDLLLLLWRMMHIVCRALEVWFHTLKTIESHFGSNVVSYFKFLRWLFVLNVVLSVCCLSFITLPQILYDSSSALATQDRRVNRDSWRFLDLLTGEGCLKSSLLFYGSYSNATFWLVNPERTYSLSHAYYMTMLILYLSTFVIISTRMARSYRKSFIEASGSTHTMCGEKVFCSWDYSIASRKAAELKHLSIFTELKEELCEIGKAKQQLPLLWRIWRFCSQLIAHLLVIALISGLGFAVWIFLQNQGEKGKSFSTLRVAVVVNGSLLLFQYLFSWIASMEDNYSPRRTLHITLVRNFLLESVVLGVVVYFWLTKEQTQCWETSLGQEMYRFIVIDFILDLFVAPLIDIFRLLIVSRFWPKCSSPEFDISQQSVGLVYNQSLLWIGLFFAPPLAALMATKLVLTFYAKRAILTYLCKSPRHVWHSAQSRTLYVVFTFLSLLGAIIALGYIMTQVPVSSDCGPFLDYAYMFQIFIDGVLKLRQNHKTWRVLMWLIRPAVIGGGLIILAIMAYYMHAKSRAHCLMVKMLKEMIYLEHKDKEFLLASITNFTKNREWLLQELKPDEDASAAADRYAESSASWRHARMDVQRHSRISGDSEQTLSASDQCILRSRNV